MTTPAVKENRPSSGPQGPGSLRVPALPAAVAKAAAEIGRAIDGEVRVDDTHRVIYATDASIYEIVPYGVIFPRTADDLVAIVRVCSRHGIPITARTAGTSLSGQTVGPGFVVDTGRYMNRILSFDAERREVTVEPGVVRDDLNRFLKTHGLLFGPDTSTSNRCMIGGMIGNNSSGAHSILYGTTRENVVSIDVVFADGERHVVGEADPEVWSSWKADDGLLGAGVRAIDTALSRDAAAIVSGYPKVEVSRRNTGYPLDDVADSWLHGATRNPSLARFLCGTEGTIALTAAATLKLEPIKSHAILVAAHYETLDEALEATVEIVRSEPASIELMDRRVLELSRNNREQDRNRWFVDGDPGGILVVEFYGDNDDQVRDKANKLVERLRAAGSGYSWPVIEGARMKSVWELRKAGLGVLMGAPGDIKPATVVEDTAVAVADLPAYIRDFARVMAKYDADCVYYAHASVGELHMRPELNLKDPRDVERAKGIASDIADLVAQYRGSLSGEHGDGRIRGYFVQRALGDAAWEAIVAVKRAFDPAGLLNPGVIVDPPEIDADWRYHEAYEDRELESNFAFEKAQGFQRAVEACNGAGVCRRPAESGGTMCPSYMATGEERETTRGRANLFRRLIQAGPDSLYSSEELRDALDLCLSCKGCLSDCPASVDMATLKAEFQQGWMDRAGVKRSARMFAAVTEITAGWQSVPGAMRIANFGQGLGLTKYLFKKILNVHPARRLPDFATQSFHKHFHKRGGSTLQGALGTVCLFVDEFSDRYEPEIAAAAVELLEAGGYRVVAPRLRASGRTWLSKGFVREAKSRIEANLALLYPLLGEVDAIVGIEPSAVLTMVDEALDLPREREIRERARAVADKIRLVQDFVAEASAAGRWRGEWTDEPRRVLLHGHCHQKALVGVEGTVKALSLPENWSVETIPSGCCGMAGSFGYEADHYETSMKIGELVLFPAVRNAPEATIAAVGTSCRHQIADGTGAVAVHPIELLRDAVKTTALA